MVIRGVVIIVCMCVSIQSGCWSNGGDMLLFALEGDPSLYYISFHGSEATSGLSTAIKCADLSPSVLSQDEDDIM